MLEDRSLLQTCISKRLLSGKAPSHEVNIFKHIKGLIYKHLMDSNHRFLALVIPIIMAFYSTH